ncbi:hypothetical protein J3F84DRAFT_359846 [Trichoderma pleuroticola]
MVASHWPDLRHISLRMECANLSTKGFTSLARHCRGLEFYKIGQEFDLEEIFAQGSHGEVLFPQLRQLHLVKLMPGRGNINIASRFTTLEITRLLEYHFPALDKFQIPFPIRRWLSYQDAFLTWGIRKGIYTPPRTLLTTEDLSPFPEKHYVYTTEKEWIMGDNEYAHLLGEGSIIYRTRY